MCETAQHNADTVKQGPEYAADKPVQDAVANVETCVTTLKGTLSGLEQAQLTILVLDPKRTLDAAALHRANDSLETSITSSTGGVRTKILSYGAKIGGPTPSVPSTDPPTQVRGKSTPGSLAVAFQCKADDRAVCYHYAWGTDASNPDAFPNSAVEGGATHKVPGPLPYGQKIFFRIAIQRRKTGLGQWSAVVEVVVR
jgi:hypothetical protein